MPKFVSLDPDFAKKNDLYTRLLVYEVESQRPRPASPKPPKR